MKAFQEVGVSLEALLANINCLVCVMAASGDVLYANPLCLSTLGYDADEVMSLNLFDVSFSLQADGSLHQHVEKLQLGEGPCGSLQFAVRTKTGVLRVLEGTCMMHVNEEGLETVTGVWQDVTSPRSSKSEMDRIFDLSQDIVGIKEFDGTFVRLNPAVLPILGYKPEEMIGTNFLDYVHPEDMERIQEIAAHAVTGRHVLEFENRYWRYDGTYCWLSWKSTTVPEEQRTYFIARDITDQKQVEMQLLLRNQAIEASPSGISIADAQLPDMPLIYVNPVFEQMTGYSAIDVIGRNCRFLQNDDRDQPGVHEIRAALREARSCTVVIRNYRQDGTLFYNELRIAPITNERGELTHFVGISTDVTQRVHTEEKIQEQTEALIQANGALSIARRQAEEAVRLKSQFLATMSHELRTPLNAIIGYTDIQLAGMAGDLTDEQTYYQDRVLVNAKHLLELINDVLDLSKIEAGRMDLIIKPFVIKEWMEDIVAQVEGLAEQKQIAFRHILDERMPTALMGDESRLRQIAINLLSNAIKFTDEGRVTMQIQKHGNDAWKLIVSDTGIGIPSHMQETIFEEFRQVDDSSSRKQGGSGLGLTIVRKLCLMMGGNIRLQSQLGKGTTVTIILPLQPAD